MAKILECAYKSNNDTNWTVEIHEDGGTPSANTFDIYGTGGVILDSLGDTSDIFVRIKPTTATFNMAVTESYHETFVNSFITATPKKYYIRLLREAALYYIGYITADGLVYKDEDNPSFTVKAMDGLGFLRGVKYVDNTAGYIRTGEQTVIEHIFNCLNEAEVFKHYDAGNVLDTMVQFYEDSHLGKPNIDPLIKTKIHHSTFYKKGVFGSGVFADKVFGTDFYDCDEVLFQILQNFNARIYQSAGRYHIEQMSARTSDSQNRYAYDATGASGGVANSTQDKTIDKSTTYWAATGGSWTYIPPLRRVEVKYAWGHQQNLISHATWDDTDTALKPIILFNTNGVDTFFDGTWRMEFLTTHPTPASATAHRYYFKVQVKIADNNGGGTPYYLKRNITQVNSVGDVFYDVPTWETTSEYIEILTDLTQAFDPVYLSPSIYYTIITNITSPIIPVSDDVLLSVSVEQPQYRDLANSPIVPGGSHLHYWRSSSNLWRLVNVNVDGAESEDSYQVYKAEGDVGSTDALEIEAWFGDAKDRINYKKLRINHSGALYQDSETWSTLGGSEAIPLLQLVARDMLSLRNKPLRLANFTFITNDSAGELDFGSRISYDSIFYLPLSCKINTGMDEITGTWMQIAVDTAGITLVDSGVLIDKKEVYRGLLNPNVIPRGDDESDPRDGVGIVDTLVPAGTGVTTIPILEATLKQIYEGDILRVQDPTNLTRYYDVTATADVELADVEITVEAFDVSIPIGIGWEVTFPPNQENVRASEDYELFTGITTAYVDLTNGIVPDPAAVSAKVISRKVRVFVNGVKQLYSATPTGYAQHGIDKANERITFENALDTTDNIEVYWYN